MSEKVIVVFPGQGSQTVGMGHQIYKNHKIAKEVFEEVDDTLNFKLSKLIFEGPIEELTLTKNAQPSLMAVSLAIVKVIEEETNKKISKFSEIIIGHSLGEYTALCSLNSINLKDTTSLLRTRGESMQNCVKNIETSMVAVIGLDITKIENIIKENDLPDGEVCEIANDNCPGQVILSGTKNGVEKITNLLRDSGARSLIDLKVSAPFHCSLMKDASLQMEQSLKSINLKNAESKFISNVTAEFETDPDKIKDLLVKQVSKRVRWRESIMKATKNNNNIIEVGSGKVLTGMNKRINKNLITSNISDSDGINNFLKNYKELL
ncbi:MAG: [acyl-carrier-protein] S-malonyltransferase [Pelagibacteraceae bacterium TMED65]|nr:[acyl-carrier-protein] S-malonyltransferase [Rickettsiales bacterium]OUU51414.1 MAG: [acyl-carrier-protein] S-malonyltransferase [Pelagibacteraceae bacterium TMED65]|tara:strand:+ start:356 stop:1318 length:963 start_codon:yes stop_codon:yes gene_type:complete